MKELIIISAVEEEFELLKLNQDELEKRWNCVLSFHAVGVGPINSAVNTACMEIDSNPAAEFLMLGSCGVYDEKIDLLDPISPIRHYFGNPEIAAGRGFIPASAFEPFEIFPFPKMKTCFCLTTPNITANSEDAVLLSRHYQCEVEHLESYASLKHLVERDRVVRELLVPVNQVGPDAHAQFLENNAEGLVALNEFLLNLEVYPWYRK